MKQMGWADTPFLQFPAKGDYMWRDLERRAGHHKLPYSRPSVYPPNTLLTARIGYLAFGEGWGQDFTREVFKRHWTEDKTIGTPDNLETVLEGLGKDPAQVTAAALSDQNKLALREQTDLAVRLGIFGSPSFVVGAGRELFWGDDRLEEAFEWVKGEC